MTCPQCQDIPKLKPGDVVFFDRYHGDKNDKGSELSSYDSGVYIVLVGNDSSVRAMRSGGGGYDMHESKSFHLIGDNRWRATMQSDPMSTVKLAIETLDSFAAQGSIKKQWVESVYEKAAFQRQQLASILQQRWGVAASVVSPTECVGLPQELRVGTYLLCNGIATKLPAGTVVTTPPTTVR